MITSSPGRLSGHSIINVGQWPIGVKLAASAISVMVLVLGVSLALISAQIWGDNREQGDRALSESASSTSRLLDVYEASARQAVHKDMGIFKRDLSGRFTLGEASASTDANTLPKLLHQGQLLNDNTTLVDSFTKATGAVSTVFVRKGDDFVRITTSVKKEDGSRAVGTMLDRKHPAYAPMLAGQTFVGRAVLFGKSFGTYYEPIREGDQTIGILFVGTDLTGILKSLADKMQTLKPFGAGSVYAVDAKPGATQGQIFGLPAGTDGASKLDVKEGPSAAFMASLLSGADTGLLLSDWSPLMKPGVKEAAHRIAYSKNAAWGWIVVSDAADADVMAQARQTLLLLWSCIGVAVLMLLGLMVWLSQRLVTQPVNRLVGSLSRLADGDLTVPFASGTGDELGRLSATMEGFRLKLHQTLSQVNGNAGSVAVASAEIAQGNLDLSRRTEQQASSLQQTAATMEQLNTTVRNNADSAHQANQLAQGASTVAARGGEVVGQVVTTMQGISESSRKIGDIIGVIDGIAFQTNILALNAAVEAARAGEQGRGFAVVAGEVRMLAQRSAEAAKEIKALIGHSVAQVEQGTVLVDQAGRTMGEIVGSIQRVSDIVAEITSASAEQSSGIAQVGDAVSQMDQSTQQNAALVEEGAAAAESLKAQAQQLVRVVSVFKLSSEAHPGSTDRVPAAPARPAEPVKHAKPAARQATAPSRPASASRPSAPAKKELPPARVAAAAAPAVPAKASAAAATDDWTTF